MKKIKGNTGLGRMGMFHISAPYDCNGKVFVDAHIEGYQDWERVDIKDADPTKIIKCAKCDKPATQLDHHYPYDDFFNLCDEHEDRSMKEYGREEE
jgi:hypothetical protein